jgi:hypothetical protein
VPGSPGNERFCENVAGALVAREAEAVERGLSPTDRRQWHEAEDWLQAHRPR